MSTCSITLKTVSQFLTDPGASPDPHVTGCPECSRAVARATAFERSLGVAARSLVSEPLPPSRRLLRPDGADPASSRPGGFGRWSSLAPVRSLALTASLLIGFALAAVPLSGRLAVDSGPAAASGPATATPSHTTTVSSACEAAFRGWIDTWVAAGSPGYSVDKTGAAIRLAVHGAFAACSLHELRDVNVQFPVQRPEYGGGAGSLVDSVDVTLNAWCGESSFAETRVCRDWTLPDRPAGYVVVSGDSLSNLAIRFGLSIGELQAANPRIANPDLIFEGEVLVIPAPATSSPSSASFGLSP